MNRIRPLIAGLCLALLAVVASAQLPARVVQAANSDVPLAWVETSEGAWLEGPVGFRQTVDLPGDGGIDSLAATAAGWIAAGTRTLAGRQELYLMEARSAEAVELPAPPSGGGLHRGQPVLVVDGRSFEGLIWLEGARYDDLSIWAAPWTGTAWGAAELVSPSPGRQQTGLSAALLADGSWLLAWAADDEQGDAEIYWSRRKAGRWSSPLQLNDDNSVPDYGVAVAALPAGGAVVVWNSFDGADYRLRRAQLDRSDRWQISELFGEKGSHRARFHRAAGQLALVYRGAERSAWVVEEVGAAGRPGRRAAIVGVTAVDPIVDLLDPAGPRAFWSGAAPERPPVDAAAAWEAQP